ncbi:MAG TPA: pilus assembly protein PilP [Gammaproteobacteria bacterium]
MKRACGKILNLTLAAALLAGGGCSRSMKDLEQYVETTRNKYQGSVEPLPQFEPYQNYVYTAFNSRDPFIEPTAAPEEDMTAGGPDIKRRKEPLEFFPMDALKMVGILEQKGEIWGLIQDSDGTIHRVQNGNHAGENYGEIIRISEESIQFLEIIPDGLGAWIEREISLSIGGE